MSRRFRGTTAERFPRTTFGSPRGRGNRAAKVGAGDTPVPLTPNARFATMQAVRAQRHMATTTDIIRIDDYPQLALLAWNRAVRDIAGEEALALYEANWRFVDEAAMATHEKVLLDRLTRQYGRGVLNV